MGTKITDIGGGKDFAPTAELKTIGASITGVLGEMRTIPSPYEKPYVVYSLKVTDAACKFTSNKKEVEPEANSIVDVFAPTRLQRQLAQVQAGQTVSIKYLGTTKLGKGNPAHMFEVEVI